MTKSRRVVHLWVILTTLLFASSAHAALPSGQALKTRLEVVRLQFDKAIDLYVDGHYAQAEDAFRAVAANPQLADKGREVADFMVGKCLYASGAFRVCREFFTEYMSSYPESPYRPAAQILVGHCQFQLGEMAAAVSAYMTALDSPDDQYEPIALANLEPLIHWSLTQAELEFLLTSLSDAPAYDWIRLWIADRSIAEGRARLAKDIYHELATQHSSSEPGRIARDRLVGDGETDWAKSRFVIAVLAPLSGDFAEFGLEMARGAQLAASDFSTGVKIITFDTEADSARAVALTDSVAFYECDCVIGPLASNAIMGTAPRLDRMGIPQVLPLARRGGYAGSFERLFQMSRPPEEQAEQLARYATQTLQLNELSALVSDTPEGHAAGRAFAQVAEWEGRTIYPVQYFTPGDTDFGEQLRALRQLTLPPDLEEDEEEDALSLMEGMLVWGDAEDIVLIAPQVVFHGFRAYVFGPEGWSEKDGLQRVRASLDSTVFVSYEWADPSQPEWQSFTRAFKRDWSVVPTTLAGRVYDVVRWLGEDVPRDPGTKQIVDTLRRNSGYNGVTGLWRFDREGYATGIPMYHYVNDRISPLTPN